MCIGIGAAMTVPSALSLIVEWFPEPSEQAQAISFFGGSSALGNGACHFFISLFAAHIILGRAWLISEDLHSNIISFELMTVAGIILGGIFVQWASWRWILWFTGIVGLGIAVVSAVSVPMSAPRKHKPSWKRLDLGAVSFMTGTSPSTSSNTLVDLMLYVAHAAALILFVYAVTSGPTGWGTANVVAPLVISILMAIGFFVYEARVDEEMAALPPRIWRYPNVPILAAVGLMPFFWWCQREALPFHFSPVHRLTSSVLIKSVPNKQFSSSSCPACKLSTTGPPS